jgi:hypothetical protein
MAKAMTARTGFSTRASIPKAGGRALRRIARIAVPHARVSSRVTIGCAVTMLAVACPTATWAAGATSQKKALGISIPASARVKGTTSTATTTSAQATTTPASGTPASAQAATGTNATTTGTSAGGAQPGTVAPGGTSTATTPTAAAAPPAGTQGSSAAGTTTAPPASSATKVGVARGRNREGTRLSTAALALAAMGALLALGCLVWLAGRWLALEPRWTTSLAHSLREASYRASQTWAEFSDWARLGH